MRPLQLSALVMYWCTFIFGTFCTVAPLCAVTPTQKKIRMGIPGAIGANKVDDERAPYFFGDIDASGYSDVIWYTRSPSHPYGYHEILSGEWASAIYYDGIDTDLIDSQNAPLGNKFTSSI